MTESKPIVPGTEESTDREHRQPADIACPADVERPAYYAILTAEVRYDNRLSAAEKILYAEITALAQRDGSCWAKTSYFCELYEVADSTVRKWIGNLQKYGYIQTELVTNKGMVTGRRIMLVSQLPTPAEKSADVRRKSSRPPAEKSADYNRKNNININNTPLPPKGESVAPSQTDKLFDIFWAAYPRKADKKKARRAFGRIKGLDKLFPVLMRALERQKRSEQWNRDGGKYIPLPSTWLNGERWDDDPSGAAFPRQRQVEEQIGGYREVHKAL